MLRRLLGHAIARIVFAVPKRNGAPLEQPHPRPDASFPFVPHRGFCRLPAYEGPPLQY